MVGDFNIHVIASSQYSNRLIKQLMYIGLKQYVTEPTRITKTARTIIDLTFSNLR